MKKYIVFTSIATILIPSFIFAATPTKKTVSNTNSTPTTTTAPATSGTFTKNLKYGASGSEVTLLQQYLKDNGYLTATPNGHFGKATKAALIKFQKAKGITPASGNFGSLTRAAMNQ
jgi:peptidoglycan hydrolase-like protein with peptidoglycan-binding domain